MSGHRLLIELGLPRRVPRGPIVLIVLLALLTGGPAALAQDPNESAVDQYTEMVPTGGGGKAPSAEKEKLDELPSHVSDQIELQGGQDAAALTKVATSSTFGAPQHELGSREAGGETASEIPGSAFAAAADTLTEGSGSRLGGLFVVLLLIGGASVIVAARRQRRTRT